MSLEALVAFAHEFGPSFEDTRRGEPELGAVADTFPLRPRGRVPDWVRQRTPGQEIPFDWRIDGPTDREPEPLDVSSLGPDALAFYAPFHF